MNNAMLDALQWPALLLTLGATGLIVIRPRRKRGPALSLLGAALLLWSIWALHAGAYAVIALEFGLLPLYLHATARPDRHRADGPATRPPESAPLQPDPVYRPRHHRPTGYEGLRF